jgi:hypothetical protein
MGTASPRPHQLLAVRLGDEPAAWTAAGFTVTTREDGTGTVRIGSTDVELTGSGGGFEGWSLDGVDGAVDGLGPVDPWPAAGPAGSPAHANGVVRIDHVVLLTGDTARTVAALEVAGLEARGTRQTRAGGAPAVQVFVWAGDVILEVVGPAAGGATDDGPATVMGMALAVDDLGATASFLGPLLGTPRDAVQPGRQVATLRHTELGMRLPLLLMSPHVPSDGTSAD